MENEQGLMKGLLWGITLSIPLWISAIGWMQLIIRAVYTISRFKFAF